MTKGYWERVQLLAVLFALATGLILGVSRGNTLALAEAAQKDATQGQGKQAKDPLLPKGPDDVNAIYDSCKECHGKTSDEVKKGTFAKDYKSNEFIFLTEGLTWAQQDPHSSAFKVLQGQVGKKMTAILGYDVTKASQCLTCHSINKNPDAPLPTKDQDILARFARTDGVACAACHGIRKPWQSEHYAPKETPEGGKTIPWRTWLPGAKQELGMRNLRDPVVKAELCVSCHVGNPSEGKIVSHEMYAAGHPPLPPFELATFMECQPKHWGYPTNPALKFFTDAGINEYVGQDFAKAHPKWKWELYRFHQEDKEVLLARPLVAGAIASLQAEMRMIAKDATNVAKGHESGIDFARFDCFACHHDLKYPSDRQARGYAGPPGRPPLKAWVAALPGVIVDHAASLKTFTDLTKEFHSKWDAVQKASLARPFGNPEELAKTAGELAVWCDEFLKRLQNESEPIYTKNEETRLLAAIGKAAVSKQWTADPEAAMHLTWAYVTLRRHMLMDIPLNQLEALKKTIPVQVRAEPYSTEMGPRTVGDTLRQRLDVFRLYDPKDFSKAFREVIGDNLQPQK
jgi:hypothetical protein